ncbi:MAG: hypothetical protein ACE5EB_03955 [Thermodesulfobacteriota bacterium]
MGVENMGGAQEHLDKEIIDYIAKNEGPEETDEGITAWWQNLERLTPSVDQLTLILENLVEKGVIEQQVIEQGIFVYKLKGRG